MFGITFHYFADDSYSRPKIDQKFVMCQGALTEEQFEDVIGYLQTRYRLIGAEQFIEEASKGCTTPDTICLTFDDGLKSQYEIAWPVMKKHGLTGFYFINTCWMEGNKSLLEVFHDFRFRMFDDIDQFYLEFYKVMNRAGVIDEMTIRKIETFDYDSYLPHCIWHTYNDKLFRYTRDQLLTQQQYMDCMFELMRTKNYDIEKYADFLWINESDICDLRRNRNIIGLHTHNHPTNMKKLTYSEKEYEYKMNQKILQRILKEEIRTVSYPCGYYDSETGSILKNMGVDFGFLAFQADNEEDRLKISRINHPQIVERMTNEGIS